jgi:hypothetical protein
MPTAGGKAGRLTTERPNTMPDAAMADRKKPGKSIGAVSADTISGRKRPASHIPSIPIGTLMMKIQCHVK